ncbi:hypothetical protein GCM10007862_32730 [Dyella lipolytica]|uniref:Protease inhibitor I42 family protein n=1 Tax=Dyella lipolytica TaxID=1867835 RepID=A0ABW8IY99_9GAMM|nr:protease inhibitor I42 family protein [Dyella lipolytica]GLQ48222.1 hypothetical protein GCM10007862_32730 [Dyella lipolytica]
MKPYTYALGMLLTTAATLLMRTAGAANAPASAPSPSFVLTEIDNRREITLNPGQVFSVQLPQTPGTGYTWSMNVVPDTVLKTVGTPVDRAEGRPIPGKPGVRVWTFVATGVDTSAVQQTLRFEYRRWWSSDFDEPGRVIFYHVVVRARNSNARQ